MVVVLNVCTHHRQLSSCMSYIKLFLLPAYINLHLAYNSMLHSYSAFCSVVQ